MNDMTSATVISLLAARANRAQAARVQDEGSRRDKLTALEALRLGWKDRPAIEPELHLTAMLMANVAPDAVTEFLIAYEKLPNEARRVKDSYIDAVRAIYAAGGCGDDEGAA